VKGSGLVCVGVGAQVWFAQVKGLRFGLCRCRGSGLVCVGVEGLRFGLLLSFGFFSSFSHRSQSKIYTAH
jgi:hypothetical protein